MNSTSTILRNFKIATGCACLLAAFALPASAQTFRQQPSYQQQQQVAPQQQERAGANELLEEGLAHMAKRDVKRAIDSFTRSAQLENTAAMLNLGQIYMSDLNGEQDAALALSWFGRAAHMGNGMAAFKVGEIMHYGANGIKPNLVEAARYYQLSTQRNGPPEAAGRLAMMMLRGEGIPQDVQRGAEMLEQSAEGGDANSMFNYGLLLLNGGLGERNFEKGLMLLEAARITAKPHERTKIKDAIDDIVVDMDFKARTYYQDAARNWLSRR
ncbi:MAG: hypothetical protein Alpg2KO_21580 [Alphaproteobacteria bacterium]